MKKLSKIGKEYYEVTNPSMMFLDPAVDNT